MMDPLLLRSFIAVVDTGSFTRAGDSVHLTQSTVSQHLRRLEEHVGCELVVRGGRYVVATSEGERLLGYARKIVQLMDEAMEQTTQGFLRGEVRLGVPEDFAGRPLMATLSQFATDYAGVRLEISSGLSNTIWEMFERGELDIALVKQRPGRAPAQVSWPEPLAWMDSRRRPAAGQDPLPLVAFPHEGLYRNEMIHALDTLGKGWRFALISPSLATVRSAVAEGVGITVLPRRLMEADHRELAPAEGFPAIPDLELALLLRSGANAHAKDLASRIAIACRRIMAPQHV